MNSGNLKKEIILGSKSPRRQALLKELCIPFKTMYSDAPEFHPENTAPEKVVTGNAVLKAQTVAQSVNNGFIIGVDTIVYFEGKILNKPDDYNQAIQYIKMMNGKPHTVYSAVALIDTQSNRMETGFSTTEVFFRRLDDNQIKTYVEVVHPYDKAGGYAIQGFGALIVEKINGCYFNVMGLPIQLLDQLFNRFGTSLFEYIE